MSMTSNSKGSYVNKTFTCLAFQQMIFDSEWNKSNLKEKLTILSAGLASVTLPPCIIYGLIGNIAILILLCLNVKRPDYMEINGFLLILSDIFYVLASSVYYIPHYFAWWSLYIPPLHYKNHIYCKMIFTSIDLLSAIRMNLTLYMIILCLKEPHYYCSKVYRYVRLLAGLTIVLTVSLMQSAPSIILYGLWIHDDICLCLPHPQWSYEYHKFYYIHKSLYLDCLIQSFISLILSIPLWNKYQLDKQTYSYLNNQCKSYSLLTKILINLKIELQGHRQNELFLLIRIYTIGLLKFLYSISSLYSALEKADLTLSKTARNSSIYILTLFGQNESLIIIEIIIISGSFVIWYITSNEIQLFCKYFLYTKLFVSRKKSRALFTSLTSQDYVYLGRTKRLFHSNEIHRLSQQRQRQQQMVELSMRSQKKVIQQLDTLKEHLLKMHAKDLKGTQIWERFMSRRNYLNQLHKIQHEDEDQTLNELAISLDMDPPAPIYTNLPEEDHRVDEDVEEDREEEEEKEEEKGEEGEEEEEEEEVERRENEQPTIAGRLSKITDTSDTTNDEDKNKNDSQDESEL